MKFFKLAVVIQFLLIFSMMRSQEKTFWRLQNIERVNKKVIYGIPLFNMQTLMVSKYSFTKTGDLLNFDLPRKFSLNIKDFTNLSQMMVDDFARWELADAIFENDYFKVRMKTKNKKPDGDDLVLIFKKEPKEKYEAKLRKNTLEQNAIADKVLALQKQYQKNFPFKLDRVKSTRLKEAIIRIDTKSINLKIPENIDLNPSGDLISQKFGDIQTGTLVDQSEVYKVYDSENNYYFDELNVFLSSSPKEFDMEKFLSDKVNPVIFKKEKNKVIGAEISYDFESKEAYATVFMLKYFKVNNIHIFLYASVDGENSNSEENIAEITKILNYNYSISENMSLRE